MDKETLSNYGWIVVLILVLSVMIAMATPFGQFIASGIKSTTQGLFDVQQNAIGSIGLTNLPNQSFDEQNNGGNENETPEPEVYVPSATFTDGTVLSWEELKDANNAATYGYKSSYIYDTYVNQSAFENCSTLVKIVIPKTVTGFSSNVFKNCSALTNIYFEEDSKLTTIGESAFYNCEKLTEILIPSTVTTLGKNAFYSCDSLATLEFGEGIQLTKISETAFAYCKSLKTFELPSSVQTIDNGAFRESGVASVTIKPDSKLTYMGRAAFAYCKFTSVGGPGSGADIEIPANMTNIENAFWFNFNLETVDLSQNNKLTKIAHNGFDSCALLTSVILPDSITLIDELAFSDCRKLESIVIPANVTTISRFAFSGCDSMTSVVFKDNSKLTTIGTSAFTSCSALKAIAIPNGVTKIEDNTFTGCTAIETICLPSSLTYFVFGSITGCYQANVIFEDKTNWVTDTGEAIDPSRFDDWNSLRSDLGVALIKYLTKQ